MSLLVWFFTVSYLYSEHISTSNDHMWFAFNISVNLILLCRQSVSVLSLCCSLYLLFLDFPRSFMCGFVSSSEVSVFAFWFFLITDWMNIRYDSAKFSCAAVPPRQLSSPVMHFSSLVCCRYISFVNGFRLVIVICIHWDLLLDSVSSGDPTDFWALHRGDLIVHFTLPELAAAT